MNPTLTAVLFAAGLGGAMVGLMLIGRRMGQRRLAQDSDGARAGLGAIEGAIFALLGLLIAFTFSGASNRFDSRRQLIVSEANSIGTAWQRLDLLPAIAQPKLRQLVRDYLDHRIAAYRVLHDSEASRIELSKAGALQTEIWTNAVARTAEVPEKHVATLLLPAIGEMFDLTSTRAMAAKTHPPLLVFIMLGVLALVSALLAGFGMAESKTISRIHVVCFALIMAATVYVILDMEFPRYGVIRIDSADRLLVELRESMN